MPSKKAAEVGTECPAWCTRRDTGHHSPLWHASEETPLSAFVAAHPEQHEAISVRAACYVNDVRTEANSPHWEAVVEITHHVADRYRLISLSPTHARELAQILASVADHIEGTSA